jgi:hypothetical protein
MKATEIAKLLGTNENNVRKYKGQFRYHISYYWGLTQSADKLVATIRQKLPTAVITDSGNHFHAFVGGAKSGSNQDSFLWVTFTV